MNGTNWEPSMLNPYSHTTQIVAPECDSTIILLDESVFKITVFSSLFLVEGWYYCGKLLTAKQRPYCGPFIYCGFIAGSCRTNISMV